MGMTSFDVAEMDSDERDYDNWLATLTQASVRLDALQTVVTELCRTHRLSAGDPRQQDESWSGKAAAADSGQANRQRDHESDQYLHELAPLRKGVDSALQFFPLPTP